MTLIIGSLQLGFIYSLLAIGIYIAFRIMNLPDLTAEGSFTFGLVVSAVMTANNQPVLGLAAALIAGIIAGTVTGLLHTKLGIPAILAGILSMSGLYSINLLTMGNKANLSLIGADTVFRSVKNVLPAQVELASLLFCITVTVAVIVSLDVFFKTRIGLSIRATGDNESMCLASSINTDITKIIALAISNGAIALSGGLLAQYQQFADINSGVGILVVGLASVIIGEAFIGQGGVLRGLIAAVFGSLLYRFIVALAYQSDLFPASTFRLLSAVIVAFALALPTIKYTLELNRTKKENRRHAGH